MNDSTSEFLQALLAAPPERKDHALRILRGEVHPESSRPMHGPLLLGMGSAAQLLGVSRATLWRLIRGGKIDKVEVRSGSFRIRRSDIEAFAEKGGAS